MLFYYAPSIISLKCAINTTRYCAGPSGAKSQWKMEFRCIPDKSADQAYPFEILSNFV